MTKTMDEYFRDWEASAFGFGYGTGEEHILPALKRFLALCATGSTGRCYDHAEVSRELTPTVAWLLINALCKADVIEYGSSPRYGWLTEHGEQLQAYVATKTADELYDIACKYNSDDYIVCYPDACNCGPNGYEDGRVCDNPFWPDRRHKS